MLRKTRILSTTLLLVGCLAWAQGGMYPGLVLSDLHLISQESLPHWTSAWTGPIQGATIVAWFAEHGYPRLLPDLNGDGIVDELDTIELADRFGRGGMRTETPEGTTDASLVITLSEYVAERYPNDFVVKVYDLGFPQEVQGAGYGPYDSMMIEGIEIRIEGEPTLPAYQEELLRGETIIAGLEEDPEENTYLAGRSFLRELTPDGYTPIDFAWSKENRLDPGRQGSILDTVATMDDGFYVDYRDWVLVEFMLALSPVVDGASGSQGGPCPEHALAYHEVTYSIGALGEVSVAECVTRDGDVDTYTYTVSNLNYEGPGDGCGICHFTIPNPGLATLGHSEPVAWTFSSFLGAWHWSLPLGHCGLLPGESADFSVSVPGPTVDAWVEGGLGFCYTGPGIPDMLLHPIRTTGPGGTGCPDLIVQNPIAECLYDESADLYKVVVSADVVNVGDAATAAGFDVLYEDEVGNSAMESVVDMLAPGASTGVLFHVQIPRDPTGSGQPPCPVGFTIMADSARTIAECDEENNIDDEGTVCCPRVPEGGELGCPDLVVQIIRDDCDWECPVEICVAHTEVTVEVRNIGDVRASGGFVVRLDDTRGPWYEEKTVAGLSAGRDKRLIFSLYNDDRCSRYRVTVDFYDDVSECNEENNEVEGSECCPVS